MQPLTSTSLKKGRLLFLKSDEIPTSTVAHHFRGFDTAHHPAPEKILAGESNGDFDAPSFAEKSQDTRSQRPAAR